jgi:hypothetical protein
MKEQPEPKDEFDVPMKDIGNLVVVGTLGVLAVGLENSNEDIELSTKDGLPTDSDK